MRDLEKMAEAKKAAIRREAEERATQVDADMQQLAELAAKYGLVVTDAPELRELTTSEQISQSMVARGTASARSMSAQAKELAETYIRHIKRPVLLAELYEILEINGVKFEGETPKSTLSAVLGQAENLYSISRSKGWWLKGVPVPGDMLAEKN